MAAHDPRCRMGAHLLLVLALGIPCLIVGCGGGTDSKPAPVDAEQGKKIQKYMSDYGEQIIADNKAKAKAKAEGKRGEKHRPERPPTAIRGRGPFSSTPSCRSQ